MNKLGLLGVMVKRAPLEMLLVRGRSCCSGAEGSDSRLRAAVRLMLASSGDSVCGVTYLASATAARRQAVKRR